MYFWPFLKTGAMSAVCQSSGITPVSIDTLKIMVSIRAMVLAISFRTHGPIWSGPHALYMLSLRRSLRTPFSVMLTSGAVGYGLLLGSKLSGMSPSCVKTASNWAFRISALTFESDTSRPFFRRGAIPQPSDWACFMKVQNLFMPRYGCSLSSDSMMPST